MPQSVAIETPHPTYNYTIDNITPAANATDVLTLVGAAGKCIRITTICISGAATAAALLDIYITKRTSSNSGGTHSNPSANKYDSLDPAATAVLVLYTENPTILGTGSTLKVDKCYLPAQVAPAGEPTHLITDYTGLEAKCPVLRNAKESISINLNGQTIPDGTDLHLYIEWTEEAGV